MALFLYRYGKASGQRDPDLGPFEGNSDYEAAERFAPWMGGGAFVSGIRNAQEIESWFPDIKFLDEWTYLDSKEKKIRWLRLYEKLPGLSKLQWIVHFKLG